MSHAQAKRVAVFGAGVAGLTAAHEFARRGYNVSVYEANAQPGGFFRSERRPGDGNMPSEYSWHGMGPFHHNTFDIMKQIPFDDTGSVYDTALSRPIDFGLASDDGYVKFYSNSVANIKGLYRMTWRDVVKWAWLLAKTWAANRRTLEVYSQLNAAEQWKPLLTNTAWNMWKSCFGPWIGSDWTHVPLHQAGQFFRMQLIAKTAHYHPADADGPAWVQGPRDNWLLLSGPSNEFWFDPWVKYLKGQRVAFFYEQSLQALDFDGEKITAAHLVSGEAVGADIYVLAINPFIAAEVVARTPALAAQDQLRFLKPLTRDKPHIQVSFRLAFSEEIHWPKQRAAIIITDSEFDLTLFPQEQVWAPEVDLGDGVDSLWTVTACVSAVPGRLYGLPVDKCTKEQFIEEVQAQMYSCQGLDQLVREANDGRGLKDFPVFRIEVWHEWEFSSDGIRYHQPKWVNRINTQQYLPTQATPVPNLVMAGAHTKTDVDIWSVEAAVESGRRAVQAFEPQVTVVPQYLPWWLRAVRRVDDALYAMGAPNVVDVSLAGFLVLLSLWLVFGVLV